MTVTLVTSQSAAKSPQTDAEWRALFDELKAGLSLGDFQRKCGIGLSRATWNKYERGIMALSDEMKRELRAAVGLPVPVLEAVAVADANAAVYRIGDDTPHTVVMVSGPSCTLTVNGAVTVAQDTAQKCQPPAMAAPRRNVNAITVSRATRAQNERRRALGVSWHDVHEAGLRMLEMGNL